MNIYSSDLFNFWIGVGLSIYVHLESDLIFLNSYHINILYLQVSISFKSGFSKGSNRKVNQTESETARRAKAPARTVMPALAPSSEPQVRRVQEDGSLVDYDGAGPQQPIVYGNFWVVTYA